MEDRWIKIQAKLLEWEWFKDGCTLQVFMYMLISASYKKETKYNIELEAGMLATNIPTVASMTGLSENWARHSINNLLNTGEISVVKEKSTTRFRVFRVSNWRKYQCSQRDLGFNDCTATTAPQPLHPNDCTSITAPQSLHLTDCAVPPHTVEGKTPPVDSNSNIIINKKEEEISLDARTRARGDVPSEWTKLANDLWNAYPRKQDMIPSLTAVIRAIEREGDFGTFKALAITAVAKFAEITAKWKQADRRYIPKMSTFFDNASYRDDPSSWERNDKPSHGGYDFTGMKPVTQEELDGTTEVF